MIETLYAGGMVIPAQKLLKHVYEDYSVCDGSDFKRVLIYLKDILYAKISNKDTKNITMKDRFLAGVRLREIAWSEWIANFPGCSVESLEDRQHGYPISWGKLKVDDEWFRERKAGVFYSVNGFHDSVRTGMKRRREKGNLKHLNAFMIDLDKAPTAEAKARHIKKISESKLLPSFVVETRNGYHILWLLESGYGKDDVQEWKAIQNALIGHFGGDRACSDESRLLRMPSSWHCKDMWSGGAPYRVQIVYESGKRYRMSDFKAFGFKAPKKVIKLKDFVPSGKLIEPRPTTIGSGDRHAALKEEAGRLYARLGTDPSKCNEARDMLKNWYQKSCSPLKQEWESEVDKCCDWIETQQFGQKVL